MRVKIYQLYKNKKQIIHNRRQLKGVKSSGMNNVFGNIDIVSPNKLIIGNGCSFNHGCYINASNGIMIGNDVTFSAHCNVISTGIDYKKWAIGEKKHISNASITIGDHVWIGANATILPSISITGRYVIVAAGAVVTKNITEDYCIVAGNPAKIIKHYQE